MVFDGESIPQYLKILSSNSLTKVESMRCDGIHTSREGDCNLFMDLILILKYSKKSLYKLSFC